MTTTTTEKIEKLCNEFKEKVGMDPTLSFVKALMVEQDPSINITDLNAAVATRKSYPSPIQLEKGKRIDFDFWKRIQDFVSSYLQINKPNVFQKGKINHIVAAMATGKGLTDNEVKDKISGALLAKFKSIDKKTSSLKKSTKAAPAPNTPKLQINAKIGLDIIEEALGVALPAKFIRNIGLIEIEADNTKIELRINKK